MRVCLFVVLLAGCGRVDFEPLDDGGGNVPLVCPDIPSCPDDSAPVGNGTSSVGRPVLTNHGLSTKACSSGAGNPELAVLFRPFADLQYTITVTPANSAVYVQDRCCGGTELVCGRNPVTLARKANENFVVVVEALPSTQVQVQVVGN